MLVRSLWSFWGRELCYAPPDTDRAHHAQWNAVATAQALGMPRDRPLPFLGEYHLAILTGPISGEVRVLVQRGKDRPFCPFWGLSHLAMLDAKYGYAPPLRWVLPREKSTILERAHRDLRQLRPRVRLLMGECPSLWDDLSQK